jgi:hypothetical protein
MMRALRGFLGENDMMAYLTMMANRLLELDRALVDRLAVNSKRKCFHEDFLT